MAHNEDHHSSDHGEDDPEDHLGEVKEGCKMAYPAIPPMGSVNPESKAQPNAFHLDSVA